MNSCLRMANPSDARGSVQGVFHPGYRPLQADVAERLGDPATMILKGGGGEFERTPFKSVALFGARAHGRRGGRLPLTLVGAADPVPANTRNPPALLLGREN